ncbi:uncharacterized protein LOC121283124 isoform X2 [Carcharodon carcharias]|uniref:uncharacterized protein LOC121283124 isoform X2 n=1 Tax=Carcharodon carcharias TaxID=13397 RepID=UPI001B7E04AC|nr:uncharacterized protein LOC121283124 isoform X2 [Carcharodon carcharias]
MGWAENSLPFLVQVVVALVTLAPLSEQGDLIVSMNSRTVKAKVNDDVHLECRVSGHMREIDLKNVGVQWFFQKLGAPDTLRREVYQFTSGKHTPYRKGATILDDDLKMGIASLFLPNVQFAEEGDYTCVVFITPDNGSGKSSMTVSASPKVSLSSATITIENGTEKSVKCDSVGFYPISIEMNWRQKTKDGEQIISKHICTGSPVKNDDGTYSVSSRLRLRPTLQDDGNTYICYVKHRSLSEALQLTAQLTVKVPPKVSDISKPPRIIHFQEALLNCQISGYRPENISVHWLLQRKWDKKPNTIHQWNYTPRDLQDPVADDHQQLISNCGSQFGEQDESFKFEMPTVEHNNDGSSSVNCKVMFWPDIHRDNEAILQVQVQHSTLEKPVIKKVKLKVEGIEPRMTDIVIPPCIIHEEVLAVTCPINGFKPRPLAITWSKKRDNVTKEIVKLHPEQAEFIEGSETEQPKYAHSTTELEYEDRTHSVTSVLHFIPTINEDHGAVYICEVTHPATASKICKEVNLNIKAIPKCDDIKLSPEIPIVDEPAYASCRIYSFFPKIIKVIWKKDGILLKTTNADSEVVFGEDGLCNFISRLRFVPVREDIGKMLTCEFQHESIRECRKTDYALIPLVSPPLVGYIRCEPEFPEAGKEATIVCNAYGFFPKETMFMWFKNDERTDDPGITSTDPQLDEATGFFYRESRWKLLIKPEYHQMEFKVEVLHFPTSHKPSRSSFILCLGGHSEKM